MPFAASACHSASSSASIGWLKTQFSSARIGQPLAAAVWLKAAALATSGGTIFW